MAEVAQYDLHVVQGATLRKVFIWKDAIGDGIPLAGWGARMQIRDKPKGGLLQLDASTESGEILLEPTGELGEIHVRVGADQTAAVRKTGFWDLEIYSLSDPTEVKRLIQGRAILNREVTA